MMKWLRKPAYDLGFVLFVALIYLGLLVAVIIANDYVTPSSNIDQDSVKAY
jgi:hypothetical protein